MKPAAFEYSRPADLAEACTLLAGHDDARVIAGGQTLVPLMAMRLARPGLLIDISRLAELAFVRREEGTVVIGATTRQCVLERDPIVAADVPLLAKVIPFIGHAPTRARGTIGGSLANADPSAESALVATTLDATLRYRDVSGSGEIAAADFFLGPMMTALPASAILTSVHFPVWSEARVGTGFHEISARKSDFAFASAAAQIALDGDNRCARATLGIGGITPFPMRLARIAEALQGTRAEPERVREAVTSALAEVEPLDDLHATAAYRRRVAVSLAVRAVADAYGAAGRGMQRGAHAG
ncbi:MAG: xanthine dehydrogenase family protein subunit M [Hyphomicrobiales bacterium]|nr:xanthine dehydrogenase family protein subunit M [Hyphomicrobiales bacterium]